LQEIALSNTDCGSTIEEVEAHLKAHDAFQNLVAGQEEKVASLRDHADKLVRQKHFDAATIAAKLAEIQEKRSAVAELCTHKTNLLNLNYLYAKFMQVSFWHTRFKCIGIYTFLYDLVYMTALKAGRQRQGDHRCVHSNLLTKRCACAGCC
jgi:hypothetical protein